MQAGFTLAQEEYNCSIQVVSAVLDWKAARLSAEMLKNQGRPEERVTAAHMYLSGCERVLSDNTRTYVVDLFGFSCSYCV